jgi:hypothetical protein
MASKSRQRKFQGKRAPEAPGEETIALASHKPWQIAAVCVVLVVVTVFSFRGYGQTILLHWTTATMSC